MGFEVPALWESVCAICDVVYIAFRGAVGKKVVVGATGEQRRGFHQRFLWVTEDSMETEGIGKIQGKIRNLPHKSLQGVRGEES